MRPTYALIAVARPLPEPLTYSVPPWMSDTLQVGHVVMVPLGRGQETGYVVGFTDRLNFDPAKAKPISRVLDPTPAFDADQLAFFEWMADYYLASLGMVISTAVPKDIKARTVMGLFPSEDGADALAEGSVDDAPALLLREIVQRPGTTARSLARRLRDEIEAEPLNKALKSLERRGLVRTEPVEIAAPRAVVRTVRLTAPLDDVLAKISKRASRQRALAQAIGAEVRDVPELAAQQGSSARASLNKLVEAGLAELGEREDRDVLDQAKAMGARRPPNLNDDQQAALAALTGPDRAKTWLLWGVTGSGKTEVFLGAAADTLARNQHVLVLVPEIGLTPQLVGRFKARFGEDIAVLHSGLTGRDRRSWWRRIRAGEVRLTVGARSALFAPFPDLGLIVVDEEHDDSYKQDDGVSYSARDLAVVLGKRVGCPVILASATPAMETLQNAKTGRYGLLRLPKRATPRPVPTVELVDMTEVDRVDGRAPILAPRVVDALQSTFDRGGKAVVLYNRRGFATSVQCTSCGGAYECPNCGVSMTLHKKHRVMACHYCGLKRPYTGECPACQKPTLEELGKGTERVAEFLAETFPGVGQVRMDADTTAVRGAHHALLEQFRDGDARLLVGTQIVAKGHDFPDVYTAVVVSADMGLRMPDFRAAERTWALLVQLAGRAGRGDVPGQVLVQTWNPEHYALQALDHPRVFLEREAKLRHALHYPPFSRLVLLRLDGIDRRAVSRAAGELAAALDRDARNYPGIKILGPAAAAMPKLVGRWRFQVIIRGDNVGAWRAFLRNWRARWLKSPGRGVRLHVDVDPRHIM